MIAWCRPLPSTLRQHLFIGYGDTNVTHLWVDAETVQGVRLLQQHRDEFQKSFELDIAQGILGISD